MAKFKITHPLIEDKIIEAEDEMDAYWQLPHLLSATENYRLEENGIDDMSLGLSCDCTKIS
ncbi:MAG: hypothetical protein ACOCRO_04035 [Halanaerobiales bacterium]